MRFVFQGRLHGFFAADSRWRVAARGYFTPYNIGKEYERRLDLDHYVAQQAAVITQCVRALSKRGSICWQVGNYVDNGAIIPLDTILYPVFRSLGLKMRIASFGTLSMDFTAATGFQDDTRPSFGSQSPTIHFSSEPDSRSAEISGQETL